MLKDEVPTTFAKIEVVIHPEAIDEHSLWFTKIQILKDDIRWTKSKIKPLLNYLLKKRKKEDVRPFVVSIYYKRNEKLKP